MERLTVSVFVVLGSLLSCALPPCWGASAVDVRARVPYAELRAAKAVSNPFSVSDTLLAKGQALYQGKGFCLSCHGIEGKGIGTDFPPGSLIGSVPRNFTNAQWQAARTDGELFWVLKNGVNGTAMAPFIPLVLTEEEAWQVILYLRTFAQR